jgi:MFS family permease
LIVVAYGLMAVVRQTEVFFVIAGLGGVGWTLSASELWVAAQRAMPSWGRGRMNAAVIMISQGGMALGGVIWGFAASIAGTSYTLFGAAILFLMSLVLAGRLSLNGSGNPEHRISGVLPIHVEPKEVTPTVLARDLLAAE